MAEPMVIVCECGDVFPLPEGFFEGQKVTFWRRHGHFPGQFMYRCCCGATRSSGPRLFPSPPHDPYAIVQLDAAWCETHLRCQLKAGALNV